MKDKRVRIVDGVIYGVRTVPVKYEGKEGLLIDEGGKVSYDDSWLHPETNDPAWERKTNEFIRQRYSTVKPNVNEYIDPTEKKEQQERITIEHFISAIFVVAHLGDERLVIRKKDDYAIIDPGKAFEPTQVKWRGKWLLYSATTKYAFTSLAKSISLKKYLDTAKK